MLKAKLPKPKPPEKKKPEPKKKVVKPKKKKIKKQVKKKLKKRVEVASLPKPRPKPREARKPIRRVTPQKSKVPVDPLAMFRAKPKGRPNAPRYKLSDEDADRITKAAEDERRRLEKEAGEAVSLDTKDYRYASYFAYIKERIKNNWSYPDEAKQFSGKLFLQFTLHSSGRLVRVRLLRSTGYKILDEEALSAIAKSAPFKPFPQEMKKKSLTIKGSFSYENSPNIFTRRR
jgi:protein TonB